MTHHGNDPAEPLYLDHNATTPVREEVVDRVHHLLREAWGNPSCSHPAGRRAREALESARAEVAAFLGADPEEIVFTSGGTEANNLALVGAGEASTRGRILISTVEHPATSVTCEGLAARGFQIEAIGVDGRCRLDLDAARRVLESGEVAVLSVMHANNETGTLQPIAELARVARELGTLVHTDAAQSAGKVAVDVGELGADLLSLAGHKLYAPKGVGVLYVRAGTPIQPCLRGAGQERGLRPGTENVAFAAGLGLACTLAARDREASGRRLSTLRDRLWEGLRDRVPGLRRHGDPEHCLPNTLNVGFPEVSGRAVLDAAPGIAASTGSACHDTGLPTPSPVLLAMGFEPADCVGAIRLSLGKSSTEAVVDAAVDRLAEAWSSLRGSA